MKKRWKWKLWNILDWVVLGLITLWLILKVMGIINTPLWLQYAPVFGAVFVAGKVIMRLEMLGKDVIDIKDGLGIVNKEFHTLEINVTSVRGDVKHMKDDIFYMKEDMQHMKKDISRLDTDMRFVKRKVQVLGA